MMNNVIIHIPHSSLNLPDIFYSKIHISKEEIEQENIFVCDYLVDKFLPSNFSNIIKFEYSRLFLDVERFKDDNLEEMSKYGMGVVYTKAHKGKEFNNIDLEYKNKIIDTYYNKHHELLDNMTSNILEKYSKCYILDLHSFSDEFIYEVLNLTDAPDICIGYNDNFYDLTLINKTINHFKNYEYTVKANFPYSGSIIPNRYYNNNNTNIYSLMIEINKRIYLDNNVSLNLDKYSKLKKCMNEYYKFLDEYTI